MHLSASDFIWEPDQGLEGGAWVAWHGHMAGPAHARASERAAGDAISSESEIYAVVQPVHEDGTTYVDEMTAPTDYADVRAWWFDGTGDAFLDPMTSLPIDTYTDFEVSEAPAFATYQQAVSAFQEPPAR